jgi:hypothetical protein
MCPSPLIPTSTILSLPLIREIDALLYVSEPVNFARIASHLKLWHADMEGAPGVSKLELLMAMHTMQEVNLLVTTLEKLVGVNRSTAVIASRGHTALPVSVRVLGGKLESVEEPMRDNTRRTSRPKRNILGDVLHVLTGLATDDELQQQLQLDKDIRDRVTETLSRQVSFEKDLSEALSSVHKEEENMEAQILALGRTHERDQGRSTRLMVNRHMIQDDMEKLEDVLHAVWTGTANARHSTFLSFRAGLQQVAAFRYVNCTGSPTGITVTYTSRLYRSSAVVSVQDQEDGLYRVLETVDRVYYLHSSHHLSAPVTEREVRGFRSSCLECAVLVYLGHDEYLAVRPGAITCSVGGILATFNLTQSAVLVLSATDYCSNLVVQTGGGLLRTQVYKVDTSMDLMLDSLLLQKATSAGSDVETLAHLKKAHEAVTLKIKKDASVAQMEMKGLIADTDRQFFMHQMQSYASWGLLFVISAVVMAAIVLVCCRYRAAKKAAAAAVAAIVI